MTDTKNNYEKPEIRNIGNTDGELSTTDLEGVSGGAICYNGNER